MSDKIKTILERHLHWIFGDVDGWELMRADLRDADLRGANLRGANLYGADLGGADLYGADLRGANLGDADLRGANLGGANLRDANLGDADLRGATLRGANLRGADLRGADLGGADLGGADLGSADLCGANLYGALDFAVPIACPDSGEFIGWKKCEDHTIVKLKILDNAQRLSATGRKCRCDKALVLEIQNLDGTQYEGTCVSSCRDSDFIYEIGKTVEVVDFDINRWNECSTGIHFFITREEAVNYVY